MGNKTRLNNGRFQKSYNVYDLCSEEYGIGVGASDNHFLFDKDDYDIIKKYRWWQEKKGYWRTTVSYYYDENNKCHNKRIMLHTYIYQEHYGDIPSGFVVDHINGNPSDNRKCNLRLVSPSQNSINKKIQSNNTSGVTGVYKQDNKWVAHISINKETVYLGKFENIEDAIRVRKEAEEKYYGEYARKKVS